MTDKERSELIDFLLDLRKQIDYELRKLDREILKELMEVPLNPAIKDVDA